MLRRPARSVVAGALFLAGLVGLAPSADAADSTLTISTRLGSFGGKANQGWWSDDTGNRADNTNYSVGLVYGSQYRNFFTFDLSGVAARITSVELVLDRPAATSTDVEPALYLLRDVSTDPQVLNAGGTPNAAVFGDLGTGTLYGSYNYNGNRHVRHLRLNAAGVAAANAARGGYFSVGGSTDGGEGSLFGLSGKAQQMKLTLAPT